MVTESKDMTLQDKLWCLKKSLKRISLIELKLSHVCYFMCMLGRIKFVFTFSWKVTFSKLNVPVGLKLTYEYQSGRQS